MARALLKKSYVERMKVKVKHTSGAVKYNTRAGVIHCGPKQDDDACEW